MFIFGLKGRRGTLVAARTTVLWVLIFLLEVYVGSLWGWYVPVLLGLLVSVWASSSLRRHSEELEFRTPFVKESGFPGSLRNWRLVFARDVFSFVILGVMVYPFLYLQETTSVLESYYLAALVFFIFAQGAQLGMIHLILLRADAGQEGRNG